MRSTKSSRPSLDPAAAAAPQGAAAGFRTPPPASRGRFGAGLAERAAELGGFLPAVLLFGFFFVVPLGLIIAYSFWKTADYEVVHQFTFDNYSYFFSVPAYVRTLVATLWVSALATALTLVLAFPFAYWLVRHVRPRWQKLLLALVILPFWTSYLLRIYSWLTILGEKGAINRGLEGLGIIDQPLSLLYNRPAVIVVLAYLYFLFAPIALLVLFSFNQNRYGTFPITGLTTHWYQQVFSDYQIRNALMTSLQVAAEVTILSTIVGTAAAFPLARSRLRFRGPLQVAFTLPIMIPGLLIGVSLLVLFTSVLKVTLSTQTAVI